MNRFQPLFSEAGDASSGGAGATPPAAAPAPASGGYLAQPPPAAAPGTTQSPPPAQFFGSHLQENGAFKEGWGEGLKAAGYERLANKAGLAKDEPTFLRSLDEALGMVGRKATGAAYPKAGVATDAEIQAYRADAGVPTDWQGYELKPATLPEGVQWDDARVQSIAELMHQHHVPKAAAQALIAKHLEHVTAEAAGSRKAFTDGLATQAAAAETVFRKEWGAEHDTRVEANRTFVASRFSAEELSNPALQAALSNPSVIRIIDEARRAMRETPLPGVAAAAGGGSMGPREQAIEIMKANPGWRKDPTMAKRVGDLYALDAAAAKRRG